MIPSAPNPYAAEFEQLDLIASPVFVLEMDEHDVPRYVAVNSYARALSQLELSDYIGRTAVEVFPQAYGRTAYARHLHVAQCGETMAYELDMPMSGTTRSLRITLTPYSDPETGRQLLYGTFVDITREQAVREKQVSFDTLTQEMEQFVALAAHDLRAPMRNMALLAEMLKEDFVDHGDGKLELLDMMEDVAKKSMALISDVLNHARTAETGPARTAFNLSSLCQDICDILDPMGLHRFTCTSAQVLTDRTAMQIALRNIIDNAIKFGGKIPLHVDIHVQRGENDMLDLMISDNGSGFTTSAMKFLNGGAFKIDSGYGLLGVRRMVEARGGTVKASNAETGSGAVICFSLPGTFLGRADGFNGMINEWSKESADDLLIKRQRAG